MYKAIFKSDERADSQALLNEFERWSHDPLRPLYSGNSDWTGVTAFDRPGIDRLAELPALSALVDRVGRAHVTGIRYFNLAPNSTLHRHRDMHGNLLFGISRLHVPIKTNPQAIFEVQRIPYHLGLNEIWCLDTSGLHALRNDGGENRIHIVIDVRRTPQTDRYFPRWTVATVLHMAGFLGIISWKVARDLVARPGSVAARIRGLRGQLKREAG